MQSPSANRRIRVLLVSMPRMLQDIVESSILAQKDMEIVGRLPTLERVEELSTYGPTDIVVVGLVEGRFSDLCTAFTSASSRNRVLGIAPDAHQAMMSLGELSPGGIGEVIRWAMRKTSTP